MTKAIRQKTLSLRGLFIVYTVTMLLLMFVLAMASYFSLRTTIKTFEEITDREFMEIRRMVVVQSSTLQSVDPIYRYMVWGNHDEAALFEHSAEEANQAFSDVLELQTLTAKQRNLLTRAQAEWEQAVAVARAVFEIPANEKDSLSAAEGMFTNHIAAASSALYEAHNIRIEDITANKARASERRNITQILTLISFFGGIVIFGIASFILARHILGPFKVLRDGIIRFGEGELSHRVNLNLGNELGDLVHGFNAMAERLEHDQVALEQLAIRDSLTGLYNRREFERLLSEEIHRAARYGHKLSVLLIDIDKFKGINDTLGHRSGDHALRLVASAIRDISRKGDVVARYGGDELAVLLPETPIEDTMILAERIRRLISRQHVAADGVRMDLTLSIGAATTTGEIQTGERLVDAADQAMYAAKAAGRNCVRQAMPPQGILPLALPS